EAMGISKESNIVKATGVSRTDVFYDIEYKNKAFEKLYSLFPEAKGKKIILYAPTFRGRVAKAEMPDVFDFKEFAEKFSGEYVIVANYHPLVKQPPEVPEDFLKFARDLTGKIGINELIVISDICISDYSSLVFEYSLMEKPMIFYAFDLDEYLDWRGFYYPYDEMTPGPICKTNYEMIYYIQNIDELFDKQKVVGFKHKFMRSCDGHSTDRIFELVFHKETEDMLRKTN
ncbi:MAG: CDP-glycerol glycerophosphotransferase family protein, partial [Lachnospiraceae bacterium]|nr:CDP-glycerol glycerophosphotransferase family protein [Lachnospiraceae bacterium]